MSRLVMVGVALATSSAMGQIRVVMLPPVGQEDSALSNKATPQTAEPYLLRPGHYVLPSPYSPDSFSPHLRPFPDYSMLRRPNSARYQGQRASAAYPGYPSNCLNRYESYSYPYQSFGGNVESAYNQGRYDANHEYVWYIASQRAGRLLNQSAAQFDEALRFFREGNYEQALVNMLGAAELNHDSAAPRLHAAHAMFALGRYREAVPMLERAFELSPSLAYKTYDIREEYGTRQDFDEHAAALNDYVLEHPKDAGGLTILGYITYFTRGPGAADPILRRAAKLDPKSFFIPKLTTISNRAAPLKAIKSSPARDKKPVRAEPSKREPESGGLRVVYVGRGQY